MNDAPRLLLINPADRKGNALPYPSSDFLFPSLGLAVIARLTPDHWQVRLIDEQIEPPPEVAALEANLVGITAFTQQARRAYELADAFRARGIPVVLGGIHPSALPDEAARHADAVVIGEAETIWPGIVADFEAGALKPRYTGTPCPAERLVAPDWTLISDRYKVASVQSSRGCPFDCDFCTVSSFYGLNYRQRDYDDVVAELKGLKQGLVAFADDNFFGVAKPHLRERRRLLQAMIDAGVNKLWSAQASINIAEHEDLLALAYRAGCRLLYVGFESLDPATLKGMNKDVNAAQIRKHDDYIRAIRAIQRQRIAVYGAFIYGNDGEGPESFATLKRFYEESGIDVPGLNIATPLPGSRIYQRHREQGTIFRDDYPEDWLRYDQGHLVRHPDGMSAVQFLDGYAAHLREVNALFRRRHWRTLARTRNPVTAMIVRGINRGLAEDHAAAALEYEAEARRLEAAAG